MTAAPTHPAGTGLPVLPPQTLSMTLGDGTRLDADVYRPAQPGPYPVLLQRQAYGRRVACTLSYAHPAWYAAHGYIVVVQDVRGRGTSEGVFRPGEHERDDGAEAVEWAARLPDADGQVALYGFSYQAYNQFLAAAGHCPSLRAIAPAMGPWDPARTWVYENSALRMKQMLGWGFQITAEAARRAGDASAWSALQAASGALPLGGPVTAQPALLKTHRALSHVMDWLETPSDSPFWDGISPAAQAEAIQAKRLPTLLTGGWFDTHLASTWQAFAQLSADNPEVHLSIGPWVHFPWVRQVGQIDFGNEAARDMDREHIRFFDRVLKGRGETAARAPIELFDMGSRRWRAFEQMACGSLELSLAGHGRASIDTRDGSLRGQPAAHPGTEFVVHDPWRPAPVVGGCYGVPSGPVDRRQADERGDVVTFTTEGLETPLDIMGCAEIDLALDCDRPSFDLSCVLSRVTGDGKVFQIASAYAHYRQLRADGRYRLALSPTCTTLAAGERLRLSIAGSDFPAHPVNPGTGADPVHAETTQAVITTVTLHHGGPRSSRLVLPTPAPHPLQSTGVLP